MGKSPSKIGRVTTPRTVSAVDRAALPTLGLLSSLTDGHVLRALLDNPRLTRAELATATGISKPTVAQSVRRLADAGLLIDTGERTSGRGRAGTYFTLADDLGQALAIAVTAAAIEVHRVDVRGAITARAVQPLTHPPGATGVEHALAAAAEQAIGDHGPARLAVVSAADPVDRTTGRLVALPDSPFLVGDLDPAAVLAPYVAGSVTVDNDVNWSARAELDRPDTPDEFGFVYLGEGLGSAIVSDGAVHRGRHGLAGEISHVYTTGPDGHAHTFTDVFAELGLHRPNSHAIDVPRLVAVLSGSSAADRRTRDAIAVAVCGVLVTFVALTDPEVIIIGGPWGRPELITAVAERLARQPRGVALRSSALISDAALTAARSWAVHDLQSELLSTRLPDA